MAIATAAAIKPFVVEDIALCDTAAFLTGAVLTRLEEIALAVVACVSTAAGAADCSPVAACSLPATAFPQLGQVFWPSIKIVPHFSQFFIT
jgi:hypothetical protein